MTDVLSIREEPDALTVHTADTELARYVFEPEAPAVEAPKPYLHPLRTLNGVVLTGFRPEDHRWHKGLSMTWADVSGQNFWGGPTFVRGEGYRQLDNVGRIRHERFSAVESAGPEVSFTEDLSWHAVDGARWIAETRTHRFSGVDAERGTWILDFATSLVNARDAELVFGSPTTLGRENAGYSGFFWRGPQAMAGASVLSPVGSADDQLMGSRSDWVAFTSQPAGLDERGEQNGGVTVLAFAGSSSAPAPIKWFLRSEPFAAFAPSPSFDEEIALQPGESLELRHRVVFVDRACTPDEVAALAAERAP